MRKQEPNPKQFNGAFIRIPCSVREALPPFEYAVMSLFLMKAQVQMATGQDERIDLSVRFIADKTKMSPIQVSRSIRNLISGGWIKLGTPIPSGKPKPQNTYYVVWSRIDQEHATPTQEIQTPATPVTMKKTDDTDPPNMPAGWNEFHQELMGHIQSEFSAIKNRACLDQKLPQYITENWKKLPSMNRWKLALTSAIKRHTHEERFKGQSLNAKFLFMLATEELPPDSTREEGAHIEAHLESFKSKGERYEQVADEIRVDHYKRTAILSSVEHGDYTGLTSTFINNDWSVPETLNLIKDGEIQPNIVVNFLARGIAKLDKSKLPERWVKGLVRLQSDLSGSKIPALENYAKSMNQLTNNSDMYFLENA